MRIGIHGGRRFRNDQSKDYFFNVSGDVLQSAEDSYNVCDFVAHKYCALVFTIIFQLKPTGKTLVWGKEDPEMISDLIDVAIGYTFFYPMMVVSHFRIPLEM